jgi:hypothetical protein
VVSTPPNVPFETASKSKPSRPENRNRDSRECFSCLRLVGAASREELLDPDEADEICEETAYECRAFGDVLNVAIVRPDPRGADFDPPDVGVVFARFASAAAAEKARRNFHGRTFADRPVSAELVEHIDARAREGVRKQIGDFGS